MELQYSEREPHQAFTQVSHRTPATLMGGERFRHCAINNPHINE